VGNLAVLHFAPLEFYPPIQNLLRLLEQKEGISRIEVLTTRPDNSALRAFTASRPIAISRLGISGHQRNALARYWTYVYFNLGCLLLLFRKRPERILYFETLSAFPAFVYKTILKRKCSILIHYHEYATRSEYENGMGLSKYLHRLELKLYPGAAWISHTNKFRMDRFKEDILPIKLSQDRLLPNYPPRAWNTVPGATIVFPLKVVYAGAVSLTTMFTREFATWVVKQNGNVRWDVYTYNCTEDARLYFESLNSPFISLKEGVDYDMLSNVLRKYEAGVILYNGHLPNYVFNAPNKLFEYLACGLAVWFPSVMAGSLPYRTEGTYPEVVAMDFINLEIVNPKDLMNRSGKELKPASFWCEDALEELIHAILKND